MTTLYLHNAVRIAAVRKRGHWSVRATGIHGDVGTGASTDFDTALRYALLDLNGKTAS